MEDAASAAQVLGYLSSCPLEIRWQIYELVMQFDTQSFEFEFEGPRNLHVSVATLNSLRNRRLPSIASVCKEMREYAVRANSHIKVNFICYVFGVHCVHQIMQHHEPIHYSLLQKLLGFKNVTAYFDPQRDQISFKPHKWSRLPRDFPTASYKQDSYGDIYCQFDTDAPNAPRLFAFAASSTLATASRTEFEELVLAQWDDASSKHLERTRNYEVRTDDDDPWTESIVRLLDNDDGDHELVHSVVRSCNPSCTLISDLDENLVWHGRAELDQWLAQARTIVPKPSNPERSLMVSYESQLMLLEQQNHQRMLALAREQFPSTHH